MSAPPRPRVMPDPPGEQTVAPGEVVASDWGNRVWHQSVQVFANASDQTEQFGDAHDGAIVYREDIPSHYMKVAGGWRPIGPYDVQAAEVVAQMNAGGGAEYVFARPFAIKPVVSLISADLQSFAGWFSLYAPTCNQYQVAFNAYRQGDGATVPGALVRVQILATGSWALPGAVAREGEVDPEAVQLHPYPIVTGPNGEAWTVEQADAYMAQYNAERGQ